MKPLLIAPALVLALLSSCQSAPAQHAVGDWEPAPVALTTRWGRAVEPDAVWSEHPRPQLVRATWRSLNGLWQLAELDEGEPLRFGGDLPETVLVPFALESSLSGIGRSMRRAAYRRGFQVPAAWQGRRVHLHFGAVDWRAAVWVNGTLLDVHEGGYDPFTVDVTPALRGDGPQELVVEVSDPTDAGDQPRGKQVLEPKGIWYTPTTGIWQSVWLEAVPQTYVARLVPRPDLAGGRLLLQVDVVGARPDDVVAAVASANGREVARSSGPAGAVLELEIPAPRAWSPDDPFLYDLSVGVARGERTLDEVTSYFGLRDLAVGPDEHGVTRLLLNGEPLFQVGLLDQGFWPDGLYTAPSDEALRWDVERMRALGFNLLRKHVKVEPDRWYHHCDRLGMLVWQDMPSGDNGTPAAREQYRLELEAMVRALEAHPSVVMWVVFNEGWGQHDTEQLVERVRRIDPTRWVSNASGWTDQGVGDVHDIHAYPGPAAPTVEPARAAVLGEFGGLGLAVDGHTWVDESWGYRGTADSADLTRRYVSLMRQVWRLQAEAGLSASVYTQVTDVETECNGLYTYDREVLKVDAERVACANRGDLPPLLALLPTAERDPVAWSYTTEDPGEGWSRAGFDDSGWSSGPGGFGTEGTPGAVVRTRWSDEAIWLRTRFGWTGLGAGSDLVALVHHDEDVEVFLNGELLLEADGYTTGYELWPLDARARGLLREGENVLAVRCRQTGGGQYVDVGLYLERDRPAPAQPSSEK
jgi:hypothetical protein